MIRAAATGRLDYSNADSNDAVWLLRERTMLSYSETEAFVELLKQRQLQQVSTAVWPTGDTSGDGWREHYNSGRDHLMQIGEALFPWLQWDEKDRLKSDVAQMRAEYIERFGDPSSPDAKEQDKRDREAVKRSQLDAAQRAEQKALAESNVATQMRKIRERRHKS